MLANLPKPDTFEQGQRQLFGLLMVAAGVFVGAVSLALTVFFAVLAFLFPANRDTILLTIGCIHGANLVMQFAVMIALALGGPVGRMKTSITKEGVSLEASDDDEPRSVSHHDGSGAVS